MKNSFVLYNEYKEQFELLSYEEAGQLIMAIFEYTETGNVPQLEGMTLMAFSFIRKQLDRDSEKYEKTIEKRREAGKAGGRPKENGSDDNTEKANGSFEKAKKANGFSEKQTKAKKAVDVDVNEDVDVNVDVNENEDVNVNEKKEKGAKAPKKKSGACAPVYFPLDKDLDEAFKGFVDMRKQIKKPMTARAVDMMINKINAIGDNNRAIDCLNESILHCWQNIYPEKEKARGEPEKSGNPFMDIYNEMREAEENDKHGNDSYFGGY